MFRLRSLMLPLLAVVLGVALPLTELLFAQPPKAKGRKVALLIGVNQYQNRNLTNLKYAEQDVTELAEVLKAAGFEVRVLLGSAAGKDAATRENIEAAITEMIRGKGAWTAPVGKEDMVLLAFSGHGQQLFVDVDGPDGTKVKKEVPFYCPKDAVPTEAGTLVSLPAVLKTLDEKGGGHNLLLVDACRDVVDALRGRRGGIDSALFATPGEGTAVFLACSSRQMARETDKMFPEERRKKGEGHGVFFHFVIEGLKGEAKNEKGEVTWQQLVPYVKRKVKDEFPNWFVGLPDADRQRPQDIGNFTDDPVLVAQDQGRRERRAGEERSFEIADGVKMVFCWIPPGKATLGSPAGEKEREYPSRGYWLGKYEVTQGEWQAVMGKNPSWFQSGGGGKDKLQQDRITDTSRFPVEEVSWEMICDAHGFLERVNKLPGLVKAFGAAGKFVLPLEDEWEYAYRGGKGNKQPFYWGDELNGTEANCSGNFPYGTDAKGPYLGRTCPVDFTNGGKYPAHPWGLLHMSGNVWEWCENTYNTKTIFFGICRIQRGGSWGSNPLDCRGVWRVTCAPGCVSGGFRVCFRLD